MSTVGEGVEHFEDNFGGYIDFQDDVNSSNTIWSIGVVGYHVSLTSRDANTEGRRIEPAIDHLFCPFLRLGWG